MSKSCVNSPDVVTSGMLTLCSAAQLAMLILKNGGSALDAVEAAIKTLEDREITNAGYGSNLAMDGVVECDASVVDHYGRSGAVGAVARKPSYVIACGTVLIAHNRDQEPHLLSTDGPRPHDGPTYLTPCPAQLAGLPRRYRLRCGDGHADPAARCLGFTSRERALDKMAL
jgi:hypothetical protein